MNDSDSNPAQPDGQPGKAGPTGEPLTALDPQTADAVVAVLSRAGLAAWQAPSRDQAGDVVVMVAEGMREAGMRELGQRMEEVSAAVRGTAARRPPAPRDPEDPSDGPPLMMERFADLRFLVVVVLGPLLVVTIAGPFLPRPARVVVFLLIAAGLAVVLLRRRGR